MCQQQDLRKMILIKEEEGVSGWQPIESAPKGGGAEHVTDPNWVTPPTILLRFGDEAVSVAYWDWYYVEGGRGFTDGFAWIEPCSGEPLNLHYSTPPTHWMPVPALSGTDMTEAKSDSAEVTAASQASAPTEMVERVAVLIAATMNEDPQVLYRNIPFHKLARAVIAFLAPYHRNEGKEKAAKIAETERDRVVAKSKGDAERGAGVFVSAQNEAAFNAVTKLMDAIRASKEPT